MEFNEHDYSMLVTRIEEHGRDARAKETQDAIWNYYAAAGTFDAEKIFSLLGIAQYEGRSYANDIFRAQQAKRFS